MGTFCFDQYEHPLLWCDEKKRLVERKNAEESVKLWRKKKAEEFAHKERDKKEYHEMVVNHCPWGRPGGGAPNLDVRMRNILAEGLHPTPKCGVRNSALPPCRFNDHGIGGSKIRSAADRLYITLKDHPSMTFRNKGHVDIELRYKPTPKPKHRMKLDKIVVTEQPKCKSKSRKKRCEVNDPWGKPGPGGAPWRNPKTVGSSFMRSLGWTNKELLKELDQDNPQTAPSIKSPIKTHRESPPKEVLKRCCPQCTCNCPVQTTSSTDAPARVSPPKKRGSKEEDKYPLPEKPCKPKPERIDRLCRQNSRKPSKPCIGSGGGVELVPLLARRRGMHRPISLSSTDVTKRTDQNRWTSGDQEHLNELKQQMLHRRRREFDSRELDENLSNRHFQTFEKYWGRPGNGAPMDHRNKMNLDDLLYGVPVE